MWTSRLRIETTLPCKVIFITLFRASFIKQLFEDATDVDGEVFVTFEW